MNQIDFTQPNGFPLEADATLGFMQSDYQSAILGVAKYFGNGVVLSGMAEAGSTVADGWIIVNNELVFFQGGAKATTFVISDTWVQKANEDGTLINRYKTRKAMFGSGGTTYLYADLQRLEGVQALQNRLLDTVLFEPEVVLSGMAVSSVNTGLSTLAIAAGVAVINRKFVSAPAYSGGYPVYLKEDGTWTGTAPSSSYIAFNPYTSQKYSDVLARATSPSGDIRMRVALSSDFDNTGLGKFGLKGWALCNGNNGSTDLRSRFIVGLDTRISDPGGNFWDAAYGLAGNTGGEKNHTLTVSEMPEHRHGPATVSGGDSGLVRRSINGEAVTTATNDSTGSGTEPDLLVAPTAIPLTGGGSAHENRPPFKVVVFIQRL